MRKNQIAPKISNSCCSRCITSRESKLSELYHATVSYLKTARAQNQDLSNAKYVDDGEISFLEANSLSKYATRHTAVTFSTLIAESTADGSSISPPYPHFTAQTLRRTSHTSSPKSNIHHGPRLI